MHVSHFQYLPISAPFFAALSAALLFLAILLFFGLLQHVSLRLGIGSGSMLFLLLASLIGSTVNIPLAELPGRQIVSGREIVYFGMRYIVPDVTGWPGTVIAVNVGGAVIPILLSLYLLTLHQIWMRGLVATLVVSAICYAIATPIAGIGIAIPIFTPPLASVIAALVLSRAKAAPLAYVGGSLGTLLGADLFNLDKLANLGAPIASIGGAGTFDGIFMAGLIAVIAASFTPNFGAR
jgi:uncharacterized membrane protein